MIGNTVCLMGGLEDPGQSARKSPHCSTLVGILSVEKIHNFIVWKQ